MNGEHKVCLLSREDAAWVGYPKLDATWGATCLLAAYDHELFEAWQPGQEAAWKGTLEALALARARVMAELIPMRLRAFRERVPLKVA